LRHLLISLLLLLSLALPLRGHASDINSAGNVAMSMMQAMWDLMEWFFSRNPANAGGVTPLTAPGAAAWQNPLLWSQLSGAMTLPDGLSSPPGQLPQGWASQLPSLAGTMPSPTTMMPWANALQSAPSAATLPNLPWNKTPMGTPKEMPSLPWQSAQPGQKSPSMPWSPSASATPKMMPAHEIKLDGIWRANSGQLWWIEGSRFLLYLGENEYAEGFFELQGDTIIAQAPGQESTSYFQFRQMDDILILRDVQDRVVLLRRIEQPEQRAWWW
jgi:hypothetical protein